jgi:hypothetical protein
MPLCVVEHPGTWKLVTHAKDAQGANLETRRSPAARGGAGMRKKIWLSLCLISLSIGSALNCLAAETVLAQQDKSSTDASNGDAKTAGESISDVTKPDERQISLRTIVPNILHDQVPIWTFPVKVARTEHWRPVLAVTAITAALIVADPYTEPYFRNNSGFQTYKTGALRGRNTTIAITVMPLAMYLGGRFTGAKHAENTGLLAAEAIADTQILSWGLKAMNGRLHPSEIPPHGNFRDTWFKYNGTWNNPGSFPSGHSISAFATAAVFATRYREHRWVPWVAYTIATAVSLSRVPDLAHFPSDIFAGAALGYATAHYVVLRRP